MTYPSIDALQLALADEVFSYARDRKKAAGRALGTLVEIITYYTLKAWGFEDNVVIERRVPEFANPAINHNVEFSMHPVRAKYEIDASQITIPITATKIKRSLPLMGYESFKQVQVLSSRGIKKNAAKLSETGDRLLVANLEVERNRVVVCDLTTQPFAIVECKRVGVEDGMKKGPQTIEKAKQGAYVARSVSSLQKVRLRSGMFNGFVEKEDGSIHTGPYTEVLRRLIDEERPNDVPDFILTVGVVSNHGNWFTSDNPNKELQVLSQSYDWLLFLTDLGLTEFIVDLLLQPSDDLAPIGAAFRESYTGGRGNNRFTKVGIDVRADALLTQWFRDQQREIDHWFNVIAPAETNLAALKSDLLKLAEKGG